MVSFGEPTVIIMAIYINKSYLPIRKTQIKVKEKCKIEILKTVPINYLLPQEYFEILICQNH